MPFVRSVFIFITIWLNYNQVVYIEEATGV